MDFYAIVLDFAGKKKYNCAEYIDAIIYFFFIDIKYTTIDVRFI